MISSNGSVASGREFALADDLARLVAADVSYAGDMPPEMPKGRRIYVSLGGHEIALTRPSAFDPGAKVVAREFERYAPSVIDSEVHQFEPLRRDLPLLAISSAIARDVEVSVEDVSQSLRFVVEQSLRTHEGVALTYTLLLSSTSQAPEGALSLDDLANIDWVEVIASSPDTGLEIAPGGRLAALRSLRDETQPLCDSGTRAVERHYWVDAFRSAAGWSHSKCGLAVSLTRGQEILVHVNGDLKYFMRQGTWHAVPLERLAVDKWASLFNFSHKGDGNDVKASIVEACLDASFAHHGACVSVVGLQREAAFEAGGVVRANDLWTDPSNKKSSLYTEWADSDGHIRFQSLPRRVRLELLSMDGATLLARDGRVIAAGAIVSVEGGSDQGGRMAAAKRLAEFGPAFKVSQDGPVTLLSVDDDQAPRARLKFG